MSEKNTEAEKVVGPGDNTKGRQTSSSHTSAERKVNSVASTDEKPNYNPYIIEEVFSNPSDILIKVGSALNIIAEDCLFVLDANILLAPFQVGKDSLESIAEVFEKLVSEERLFLPAQAVREFARHKSGKIALAYEHIHKKMSAIPSNDHIDTPMFEGTPEYKELASARQAFNESKKLFKEKLGEFQKMIENWNNNDPVSILYSQIFSGDQIINHGKNNDEISSDVKHRFSHKLPPGYKDASKPDGGIGDVIIWHTILSLGQRTRKNIIFVTNDQKSDWMVRYENTGLYPRPELIEEFSRVTGCEFSMLSFERFLTVMGAKKDAIKEVSADFTKQNFAATRLGKEVSLSANEINTIFSSGKSQIKEIFYEIYYLVENNIVNDNQVEVDDYDRTSGLANQLDKLLNSSVVIAISPRESRIVRRINFIAKELSVLMSSVAYDRVRMKRNTDMEEENIKSLHREFMEFSDELRW